MTGMFHSLHNHPLGAASPAADRPTTDKLLLDWPASYQANGARGFEALEAEAWEVEIMGLVERPQTFRVKELMGFTRIQQNRRLVFADGWCFRANWEGLVLSELLHRVGPQPEAQYLIQTNAAGHQECLPLKDLYAQRALFCLKVNGQPLPPQYGGPLRLMVFDRYAHKGLGQLVRLELANEPIAGYFAGKGYHPDGQIVPGEYYASDLKTMQSIKTPGEMTQW